MICPSCFGSGKSTCPNCNGRGTGRARPTRDGGLDIPPCANCGGTGKSRCSTCGGTGNIPDPAPLPRPTPQPLPKDPLVGFWKNRSGTGLTIAATPNGYGVSDAKGNIFPGTFTRIGNHIVMQLQLGNGMHVSFDGAIEGDQMSGTLVSTEAITYRREG